MLSLIVFLPLAVALVVAAVPAIGPATSRWVWVAVSVVELVLVGVLWAGYEDPGPNALAFEEQVPWIPGVNSSYHIGVDGLSLPLLAMTAVVFLACAVYALRDAERPRAQVALFLFLQGVSSACSCPPTSSYSSCSSIFPSWACTS